MKLSNVFKLSEVQGLSNSEYFIEANKNKELFPDFNEGILQEYGYSVTICTNYIYI